MTPVTNSYHIFFGNWNCHCCYSLMGQELRLQLWYLTPLSTIFKL